ncbi:MAG: preprotein translocase subunit SecG [Elusimicrobia bacterium RIFOXYB2_FULL_48_7]|nr:MAG: preprotein translocase subunit SecG [Elusimicrobia bacterium RIFOXYB2_FULL_48_7]
MSTLLLVVNIIAALFLILVILMQTGKAGGIGGILGGGGGGDQLFSTPSGSEFLRKATIIIASVFFLSTIGLTYFGYRDKVQTVTGLIQQQPMAAPAAPATPAAPTPAK